MYKSILQPFLFLLDAEQAHNFATKVLKISFKIPGIKALLKKIYRIESKDLEKELFGLKFKNPVGLAAGFDKNAEFMHELSAFGFGFLEIGTITPKGQPGNDKPRLFRLKKDKALINRLGFNNHGVEHAIGNLRKRPKNIIIGGNIGKNKTTPNEEAYKDYEYSLEALYPYVDYFVVNVSSPNTPDLRDLQEKGPLLNLLQRLKTRIDEKKNKKPILLKIAPDLSEGQLNDIIEIVNTVNISGIIATNTTIERHGLKSNTKLAAEKGGLSGKPVFDKSNAIIRKLRSSLPELPIIGVGGIDSGPSAKEKLESGADLVQIYTGFIYEGPGIVKSINSYLDKNK